MFGRLWHTNAHPLWRRLRTWWRLTFTAALAKSHQVHFITVNGRRCKRVTFPDSVEARRCEAHLEALAATRAMPEILLRHENEVWVAFIEGRPADPESPDDHAAFATFFAALYCQDNQAVALKDTRFAWRLERDLRFLSSIGVLNSELALRLADRAIASAPPLVQIGYDFIDPVLKNFLLSEGRIVAIDIEGLLDEQLLGVGIAKARLRWLGDDADTFIQAIHDLGAPDIAPQFPLAELSFLADWTKMKVLQGKPNYVQPALFHTWLARLEP